MILIRFSFYCSVICTFKSAQQLDYDQFQYLDLIHSQQNHGDSKSELKKKCANYSSKVNERERKKKPSAHRTIVTLLNRTIHLFVFWRFLLLHFRMAHGCSAKYALVALLTHANNTRLQRVAIVIAFCSYVQPNMKYLFIVRSFAHCDGMRAILWAQI